MNRRKSRLRRRAAPVSERLPAIVVETLREQWARVAQRRGTAEGATGRMRQPADMNRRKSRLRRRAAPVSERLPAIVVETLREQWARVAQLDAEVATIEERLRVWHRQNAASRRIGAIPGVGVLSATAAVATMGDPAAFKSGREFAAWLGLVPRHSGTGGRVRMLGISKRGGTYLRTLLVHGTRSVLANAKAPSPWQLRLAKRRPPNVVTVALANKTARTIWALLAYGRDYDPNFAGQPA